MQGAKDKVSGYSFTHRKIVMRGLLDSLGVEAIGAALVAAGLAAEDCPSQASLRVYRDTDEYRTWHAGQLLDELPEMPDDEIAARLEKRKLVIQDKMQRILLNALERDGDTMSVEDCLRLMEREDRLKWRELNEERLDFRRSREARLLDEHGDALLVEAARCYRRSPAMDTRGLTNGIREVAEDLRARGLEANAAKGLGQFTPPERPPAFPPRNGPTPPPRETVTMEELAATVARMETLPLMNMIADGVKRGDAASTEPDRHTPEKLAELMALAEAERHRLHTRPYTDEELDALYQELNSLPPADLAVRLPCYPDAVKSELAARHVRRMTMAANESPARMSAGQQAGGCANESRRKVEETGVNAGG